MKPKQEIERKEKEGKKKKKKKKRKAERTSNSTERMGRGGGKIKYYTAQQRTKDSTAALLCQQHTGQPKVQLAASHKFSTSPPLPSPLAPCPLIVLDLLLCQ